MLRCLRSTNLPRAVFTCPSSCIRRSRFQPSRLAPSAASAEEIQMASSRSARRARCGLDLSPEIIEVEPVVRGDAAIVLQAVGIALEKRLDHPLALPAANPREVGKVLDMDLIAVAAAIKPEH